MVHASASDQGHGRDVFQRDYVSTCGIDMMWSRLIGSHSSHWHSYKGWLGSYFKNVYVGCVYLYVRVSESVCQGMDKADSEIHLMSMFA